jgi:hypothetical protein
MTSREQVKEVKQPKMVLGVEIPEGEEDDPFYSESNICHLLESEKQFAEGKVVVKTWEELKAMEKTSLVEHTPVKQPKMVLGVEIPEGEEDDPFYSESNIRAVLKSVKALAEGRGTAHELIEV